MRLRRTRVFTAGHCVLGGGLELGCCVLDVTEMADWVLRGLWRDKGRGTIISGLEPFLNTALSPLQSVSSQMGPSTFPVNRACLPLRGVD